MVSKADKQPLHSHNDWAVEQRISNKALLLLQDGNLRKICFLRQLKAMLPLAAALIDHCSDAPAVLEALKATYVKQSSPWASFKVLLPSLSQ